jgi:hypothetical protein
MVLTGLTIPHGRLYVLMAHQLGQRWQIDALALLVCPEGMTNVMDPEIGYSGSPFCQFEGSIE